MVTKDNNPGLLSKMVKFVRSSTKDWSDVDSLSSEQDSGYTKQALKEMIERKRQNDLVRRREFDYLRKLRRNGLSIVTDRPPFFQNSAAFSQDERATTLKKIDEIEAHMSKQWWRGRQDEAVLHSASEPVAPPVPDADDDAPLTFAATLRQDLRSDVAPGHGGDYEATQMGLSTPADQSQSDALLHAIAFKHSGYPHHNVLPSDFSASNLFSTEAGDSQTDPELEEAAIRFANGDDAGAEAALLNALQGDVVNPDAAQGWAAALFDLYRVTGQQASFDHLAMDYAQRFSRSAPAWFSTPELLGRQADAPSVIAEPVPDQPIWTSPAELDLSSLQALTARLSKAVAPWYLSWSPLRVITPQAVPELAQLFAGWSVTPVSLCFAGADALEKALKFNTPSGDRRVDACWWQLRLDALRVMRLQDEFELAALDFCVTYEVSPPSWSEARCDFVPERINAGRPTTDASDLLSDLVYSSPADLGQSTTVFMTGDASPSSVLALSGEVLGDAVEALDQLQAGLKGTNRLVISCARLIRVDFSAAGSILNWVALRETEGCHVQFREVPCLVAAFFNVIGINEHARVIVRTH